MSNDLGTFEATAQRCRWPTLFALPGLRLGLALLLDGGPLLGVGQLLGVGGSDGTTKLLGVDGCDGTTLPEGAMLAVCDDMVLDLLSPLVLMMLPAVVLLLDLLLGPALGGLDCSALVFSAIRSQ